MLVIVQKLANKISCPKCSTTQSLDVGLLCEPGAGKCKPVCTCQSCSIQMIVQVEDPLVSDSTDSSKYNLSCDPVSLTCEIMPGSKAA